MAFDGVRVAIRTNCEEVLTAVGTVFSSMLVDGPAGFLAGTLNAWHDDEGYHVRGNTEVDMEDGSLQDVVRCLRYSVMQLVIAARPDFFWIHAGAAACGERVALLVGARGQGKSTITTGLCERGWSYLSDDIVPLNPASDKATPFPITPTVREYPGREMPPAWLKELDKKIVPQNATSVAQTPVALGCVIFPRYEPSARTSLKPVSPAIAALRLLEHCWNSKKTREAAVTYATSIAGRFPTFDLVHDNGADATRILDLSFSDWRNPDHRESSKDQSGGYSV